MGAGSPLPADCPADWLTGFLTYVFLCLHVCGRARVCAWANIKLLNCVKWLYFFSLSVSQWGDDFQEVLILAVK